MEVKKSFYTTVNHPFEVEHTEPVNCNLCGSGDYKPVGSELGYDIRTCSSCGLVYVTPQPTADELPRLYANMYLDDSAGEVAARSLGAVESHLRAILRRECPEGGRYLELGCGFGRLMKRVEDLPFELTAVEMSETAAAHARKLVPRADIRVCSLEEADFPPESQDCIVMVAVLEHVKDPKGMLARIARWLAPGGLLLVQTPYIAPYIRLKRWLPWLPIHFEAPRHLFDFSPPVLKRFFREAGFADVKAEIARPFASATRLGAWLIWGIKLVGLALYHYGGKGYIYPFASAITVYGRKKRRSP